MKTIVVIATGGTIASSETESGLRPTLTLDNMLSDIPELKDLAHVRGVQLMNKDSSDMTPDDWKIIATRTFEELKTADGVVITHGTDTMAYTSSALSFMLQHPDKPIILTGSQRPWAEKETDARRNLLDAIRVAIHGPEYNLLGVHIVFNGKIIRGSRAKKTKFPEHSELDAFETINYPMEGIVKDGSIQANWLLDITRAPEKQNGVFTLDTSIDERVHMLFLSPGFDPNILDYLKDRKQALLIQAYGVGDMPISGNKTLVPKVKEWLAEGKIVAVTSQACYEVDLNQYETGREFLKLGVIPTLDMTQESAYAKLMWAMGHTTNPEEVRKIMWTNYADEIWQLNGQRERSVRRMEEMFSRYKMARGLYESDAQIMDMLSHLLPKIRGLRS